MENLAEFREGVPFEFHPVANGIAEAVGGSCKDAFDRRECVRVEEVEYRKFCRAFREATELLAVGPGLDQVHRRDFAEAFDKIQTAQPHLTREEAYAKAKKNLREKKEKFKPQPSIMVELLEKRWGKSIRDIPVTELLAVQAWVEEKLKEAVA